MIHRTLLLCFVATCLLSAAPADEPKAGDVRDDNEMKLKLVWCPAGKFTMGSPKGEAGRNEDQVPVTLSRGFWLGQVSVTQSQFKSVMGAEPWKGKQRVKEGAGYPATCVDWNDATEFCKKLTETEIKAGRLGKGWKYELPTEAQREYACRAGTTTAYYFGDDASKLSDYAWWGGLVGDGNAKREPYSHEGGTRKPNGWGLYDMHGNVSEWCRDYAALKLPGGTDPYVDVGTYRVSRGGAWDDIPAFCRSAHRFWSLPAASSGDLGFRVALVPSS